jgi:hypothetical protein
MARNKRIYTRAPRMALGFSVFRTPSAGAWTMTWSQDLFFVLPLPSIHAVVASVGKPQHAGRVQSVWSHYHYQEQRKMTATSMETEGTPQCNVIMNGGNLTAELPPNWFSKLARS